ncbi:hypothetical protein, partial [Streptomyces sp. NRRL S-1521]|uniref:hypothetical protein n=1 Tax=Streptomyces sp. NRRL S-1521 TaxID=1609100 RepID=UPI000B2E9A2A
PLAAAIPAERRGIARDDDELARPHSPRSAAGGEGIVAHRKQRPGPPVHGPAQPERYEVVDKVSTYSEGVDLLPADVFGSPMALVLPVVVVNAEKVHPGLQPI